MPFILELLILRSISINFWQVNSRDRQEFINVDIWMAGHFEFKRAAQETAPVCHQQEIFP